MAYEQKHGVQATTGGAIHWLVLDRPFPQPLDGDFSPEFLNEVELDVYVSLKTEKRRRDWLMGRLAGKLLIAELARGNSGRPLALDEITILPHAGGRPIVTLPPQPHLPAITLSISHSRDRAFCAAIEGADRLIGADTEYIEPRPAGFAEEYFTPLELDFLSAAPQAQRELLVNAVWSGKEAALKAIGRGLAEATRIVSCLPHPVMSGGSDWLPLRIIWADKPASRPPLAGQWKTDGGYVMALAFAAEAS